MRTLSEIPVGRGEKVCYNEKVQSFEQFSRHMRFVRILCGE